MNTNTNPQAGINTMLWVRAAFGNSKHSCHSFGCVSSLCGFGKCAKWLEFILQFQNRSIVLVRLQHRLRHQLIVQ